MIGMNRNGAAVQTTMVPLNRKVSRDQRRQQLILATMRVMARKGYAQTTLANVAAEAGVSYGLVNFHFETKERLLAATLMFMADEYRQNWRSALEASGGSSAERLAAFLAADYADAICTPERLACWCSFWGEVQSRPLYQQECASNDETYIRELEGLCAAIIGEGRYAIDAVRAARILRFSSEGLWNDMLSMKMPYSRAEALRTLHTAAAALFPRHFTANGPILD
jgi:AcrR family transcriptional regulator